MGLLVVCLGLAESPKRIETIPSKEEADDDSSINSTLKEGNCVVAPL